MAPGGFSCPGRAGPGGGSLRAREMQFRTPACTETEEETKPPAVQTCKLGFPSPHPGGRRAGPLGGVPSPFRAWRPTFKPHRGAMPAAPGGAAETRPRCSLPSRDPATPPAAPSSLLPPFHAFRLLLPGPAGAPASAPLTPGSRCSFDGTRGPAKTARPPQLAGSRSRAQRGPRRPRRPTASGRRTRLPGGVAKPFLRRDPARAACLSRAYSTVTSQLCGRSRKRADPRLYGWARTAHCARAGRLGVRAGGRPRLEARAPSGLPAAGAGPPAVAGGPRAGTDPWPRLQALDGNAGKQLPGKRPGAG